MSVYDTGTCKKINLKNAQLPVRLSVRNNLNINQCQADLAALIDISESDPDSPTASDTTILLLPVCLHLYHKLPSLNSLLRT